IRDPLVTGVQTCALPIFVGLPTPLIGTFTPGVNGTITVNVPISGVGNPTIPITDVNGTPAVTNPYGLTIAGEGALGGGLYFISQIGRASWRGGVHMVGWL